MEKRLALSVRSWLLEFAVRSARIWRCPSLSKSNKQFSIDGLPRSISSFNCCNDPCKLYNVWNTGLLRISCKESMSACCSQLLYGCKRSLSLFNNALASKRTVKRSHCSVPTSGKRRLFSYRIIEPWWEKWISNGMHVPNSSIDKYYDGSLSFRRICEGIGVVRISTTAGFLEKKRKQWCFRTTNDRSIDREDLFTFPSLFSFLLSLFFCRFFDDFVVRA